MTNIISMLPRELLNAIPKIDIHSTKLKPKQITIFHIKGPYSHSKTYNKYQNCDKFG